MGAIMLFKEAVSTRCLGVHIDTAPQLDYHVSQLANSFTEKFNLLKSLYSLPRQARTDFCFGIILPSRPVAGREAGGLEPLPEVFRFELNSATKKWTFAYENGQLSMEATVSKY